MTRRSCLLVCLALAGCTPDVCSDIECVMAHLSLTADGARVPLTAVPAAGLPVPAAPQTVSAGDFVLLITPVSAPNWADPIQLIEAGVVADGPSSPSAALAPRITNQPDDVALATPQSEDAITLAWLDPNAATPAFCFTPYDNESIPPRPYPHCVWCTAQERDLANAGTTNMRLGINAGITSPIDFSAKIGRACNNPTDGGFQANGMRGCPSETKPCGDGCIPESAECCMAQVGDTSSYCTNSAGGMCRRGEPCAGSQNCCSPSNTFGSNDCAANERHCGLQCVSRDRPCCPIGSTDPRCGVRPVAGAGVGIAVDGPAAPEAGGGGGGGDPSDTCGYAGTYRGTFKWAARTGVNMETMGQLTASFTLEHKVTASGLAILDIVSVTIDDATLGATSATRPTSVSLATLPCGTPPQVGAGTGFNVTLANGSNLHTTNDAGALQVSADRRTFSNSTNAAFANKTWAGSTGKGDSNTPGSGVGGFSYNSLRFISWTITKR